LSPLWATVLDAKGLIVTMVIIQSFLRLFVWKIDKKILVACFSCVSAFSYSIYLNLETQYLRDSSF